MPRWIKFVALFLVAFALIDVCDPETCEAQKISPIQTSSSIQVQHNADGDGSCQFEEDCFACAHFAPGAAIDLQSLGVVTLASVEVVVPSLDGTPLLPYHPPRA